MSKRTDDAYMYMEAVAARDAEIARLRAELELARRERDEARETARGQLGVMDVHLNRQMDRAAAAERARDEARAVLVRLADVLQIPSYDFEHQIKCHADTLAQAARALAREHDEACRILDQTLPETPWVLSPTPMAPADMNDTTAPPAPEGDDR